jgi:hypothetical protein
MLLHDILYIASHCITGGMLNLIRYEATGMERADLDSYLALHLLGQEAPKGGLLMRHNGLQGTDSVLHCSLAGGQ